MSTLQDLKYYVPVKKERRLKTTKKTVEGLTASNLEYVANRLKLSEWQKNLLKLVCIDKQNFSEIARSLEVSRQYVHQEYDKIYSRMHLLNQ